MSDAMNSLNPSRSTSEPLKVSLFGAAIPSDSARSYACSIDSYSESWRGSAVYSIISSWLLMICLSLAISLFTSLFYIYSCSFNISSSAKEG